ncbi:glycosyltransferase [Aequorivita vladivostokensis]|uniref:Glycosyltransferase n=1 Tax=Aequorivita vladivostokensis TaxID=171194 RepID=A0ABR5DF06_9FLAO|nr:glycosyltransferase [Aequorivita vladivostokensis]KJJ37363.1 glycosyltransferase [Aequorivita vladivostokensis]
MKQLLIIGHTFPEPSTTAAGSRMMQLIELFKEEKYQITFASTAAVSEKTADLQGRHISIENIKLNDVSFDEFIKKLNPEIVVFDRYITEEQFGWRVSENCPNALKILDTEDLHFLRKAREEAVKNVKTISEANLFSETAKRELASILRCDLSLIISEYEMELLQNRFKIASEILYYLPFLVAAVSESTPAFEERQNFFAIGNLLHAPNVDSVLQLKKLWPEIRQQLPDAELHIYGAYAPQQVLQLNNIKEGFLIKGWADDLEIVMKTYRVQLAPLRFGAGLKGKLLDAMRFGLPSVTTEIGAEGMCGELSFGGMISTSKEKFIDASIQLYSRQYLWSKAQQNGFNIIENRFQKKMFSEVFKKHLRTLSAQLEQHRRENFFGQILQHHTLQSTKYLAKWIEAKGK